MADLIRPDPGSRQCGSTQIDIISFPLFLHSLYHYMHYSVIVTNIIVVGEWLNSHHSSQSFIKLKFYLLIKIIIWLLYMLYKSYIKYTQYTLKPSADQSWRAGKRKLCMHWVMFLVLYLCHCNIQNCFFICYHVSNTSASSLFSQGTSCSLLGGRAARAQSWASSPFDGEVKNIWSFTITPHPYLNFVTEHSEFLYK